MAVEQATRSMEVLSGGPLFSTPMPPVWRAGTGSGSPREWVFTELLACTKTLLLDWERAIFAQSRQRRRDRTYNFI